MFGLQRRTAVVGFKGIEMHIESPRSKTYCCRVKGVTEERSDKQLEAAPPPSLGGICLNKVIASKG